MSLDELLKDAENSASWKKQKHSLIRIMVGVSIVAIALGVGVVLFVTQRGRHAAHDKNADALAQLMRLQNETKDLQREINAARRPTSVKKPRASSPSIIVNFDPGSGYAAASTVTNDLYIPQGAVFQAQLITPIKTSIEKTFVIAEVTQEFRMDMKRRIPYHSRLIGRSRLNPVLKGVVVEFETLVLPSGIETSVNGLALSRNALPEIEGLYFSNNLENYGTALAFGFLSGFASGARDREITSFGSSPEVSLNNQMLAGLSTASFQVAEDILRDIRNRSIEYVVVPAGERIFVALTRRYEIPKRGNK